MRYIFAVFCLIWLTHCTVEQTVDPTSTQRRLQTVWHTPRQAVWTVDWPDNPTGGPMTVASWQAEQRYRYEILESTAPALIGETAVFDGQRLFTFNRLTISPHHPLQPNRQVNGLSPMFEVVSLIENGLADPAVVATETQTRLNGAVTQRLTLRYVDGGELTMWIAPETGTLKQVVVRMGTRTITLTARQSDPLPNPSLDLFRP